MFQGLSHRWKRKASVALLTVLVAGAGCDNPSTMFTGRWEPRVDEDPTGLLAGWPVVAMGQYGAEVAGVIFHMESPEGTSFSQGCPCSWLEHYRVDSAGREVQFTSQCAPPEADLSGPKLRWRLSLEEDEETGEALLVGTVGVDGADEDEAVPLTLVRVDDYLRDEDKRCPPAELEEGDAER